MDLGPHACKAGHLPACVICFHDDNSFDWGEMESPCDFDFLLQWWLRILNIFSS